MYANLPPSITDRRKKREWKRLDLENVPASPSNLVLYNAATGRVEGALNRNLGRDILKINGQFRVVRKGDNFWYFSFTNGLDYVSRDNFPKSVLVFRMRGNLSLEIVEFDSWLEVEEVSNGLGFFELPDFDPLILDPLFFWNTC